MGIAMERAEEKDMTKVGEQVKEVRVGLGEQENKTKHLPKQPWNAYSNS